MQILCPISLGEFWDKLTVVEIKRERVEDPEKRENIAREYSAMSLVAEGLSIPSHIDELRRVNKQIWDVENKLRQCLRDAEPESDFASAARQTVSLNDIRALLKKQIDLEGGSDLIWEKEHV